MSLFWSVYYLVCSKEGEFILCCSKERASVAWFKFFLSRLQYSNQIDWWIWPRVTYWWKSDYFGKLWYTSSFIDHVFLLNSLLWSIKKMGVSDKMPDLEFPLKFCYTDRAVWNNSSGGILLENQYKAGITFFLIAQFLFSKSHEIIMLVLLCRTKNLSHYEWYWYSTCACLIKDVIIRANACIMLDWPVHVLRLWLVN